MKIFFFISRNSPIGTVWNPKWYSLLGPSEAELVNSIWVVRRREKDSALIVTRRLVSRRKLLLSISNVFLICANSPRSPRRWVGKRKTVSSLVDRFQGSPTRNKNQLCTSNFWNASCESRRNCSGLTLKNNVFFQFGVFGTVCGFRCCW